MVIHCFAGVSRSTAAAYIAACALKPDGDEFAIAGRSAPPLRPPRPTRVSSRLPTTRSAAAGG